MPIFSILAGFISMIISIKLFKHVQWALLIAIFVTAILSSNIKYISDAFFITGSQVDFYKVIAIIYGILLISNTMRISGKSDDFAKNIKHIFSSSPSSALMPMFLGLLPMPGGAMFTAPMVRDIADKSQIDRLTAATVNYWFRHSMEFFWILYPALVMYSALTGIPLTTILIVHLPIGLAGIISAWLYFKIGKIKINHDLDSWKNLFISLFPILIIIIGVTSGLPGWIVVLITALTYSLYYKNYKGIINPKWSVLILLFFVFWYKNFIEISDLSENFVIQLQYLGMSPWWIIALSPIVIGLITGITQAAFAVTMPIAVTLASTGVIELIPAALTTYYFAVIGVLFSPVHLCLLLSGEFFNVKLSKICKKMIVPLIFSTITYIIIFFLITTLRN